MTHRVIDSQVREIIQCDDLTSLWVFIQSASVLVDELLADKGLSDDRLTEIERWLAAHFVAMRNDSSRVTEVQVGESRERYGEYQRGVLAEGLKMTRYGQQAMVLDTTGTLSSLYRLKARFTVNG